MNSLEALLRQISNAFAKQRQSWALVGGLAVSVRTEPRFTRDLDLAVAVKNDSEAEELVNRMHGLGFQAFATVEQEATGRLATARLAPLDNTAQGLVLDLLFASSGIETEICMHAEYLQVFPNLSVPVASIHHLIVLKILSRDDVARPQDIADLRQLITAAEPSSLPAACDAAKLIESRGFNRERDLIKDLQETWSTFRK